MKNLSLCLILALPLVACGSKDEAKKVEASVAATPNAAVKTVAPAADAACPNLNGKYEQKKDANSSMTINIATKVEGGKFSYSFDEGANFLVADGQVKRIENAEGKGTLVVSCDAKSIKIAGQEDGKAAATMQYTVVSDTQIKLEGTGEMQDQNGLYTKL